MKGLYDKIYKAINEGIIKSLTIPDEQDNQLVNYKRSNVKDNMYSKKDFENAVDNLLKENSIENYNEVLKYSMFGIWQHEVKDYNELTDIFDKIFKPHIDNFNLSWIDTTDILTFIMRNGDEVSLCDINNVDNVMFIKFNNIKDFNYPIIIHKDLLITDQVWSNNKNNVYLNNNNDGYKNTYNTDIINDLDNYPAFKYCIYQSINGYKGYLPAIYELNFLSKNKKLVNYILEYVKGKVLNIDTSNWWSSSYTFESANHARSLYNGSPSTLHKNFGVRALPFFRKIN